MALGEVQPRGLGTLDLGQDPVALTAKIAEICRKNDVSAIILGLPLRSRGEEGTLAPEIRRFAERLSRATGLPVLFEEEQFTSTEAEGYLKERGEKFGKEKIDEIAAVLLLEQYLAHRDRESNR